MNKIILFVSVACFSFLNAQAQKGSGFAKNYTPLKSGNWIIDKDFYFLTAIEKSDAVKKIIASDPDLKNILQQKIKILKQHITDTCSYAATLLPEFKISKEDSITFLNIQTALYQKNTAAFDALINNHLRPSGFYQRFTDESNLDFLLKAWGQYVVGVNYIIDQFGYGKKMRYPRIDSCNYDVNSRYYRTFLKTMLSYIDERTDTMTLFYQPSSAVALQLMDSNDRDEPARHEPMEQRDNKAAYLKVAKTDWKKYKYAAIVVPGNGPELLSTPLSPINKIHCDLAAQRFLKGWAPFIIVSGGYCYPFSPQVAKQKCEAIEMKKYIMERYNIGEEAIIIDPHARHTTTNFRNANRLMIRYGFPMDKLCVFTTGKDQTDYVMNLVPTYAGTSFDVRNQTELGYMPYIGKNRISNHDVEYLPNILSLHLDPFDPLDP